MKDSDVVIYYNNCNVHNLFSYIHTSQLAINLTANLIKTAAAISETYNYLQYIVLITYNRNDIHYVVIGSILGLELTMGLSFITIKDCITEPV